MRVAIVTLLLASCAAPAAAPLASAPPGQWSFDAVTQPGRRGGDASVTIHGLSGVPCTAVFLWPGAPSDGQRIAPVTTDTSGSATFRWSVDPATPPGSWRIDATCAGQVFSTHVPID